MSSGPHFGRASNVFRKTTTLLLLASFVIGPVVPATAKAQVETRDTTQIQTDSPPSFNFFEEANVTPQINEETVQEDIDVIDTPDTADAEVAEETDISSDTQKPPVEEEPQSLAQGSTMFDGGTMFINNESTRSATPEVDTQTGALKYGYKLTLPPGRNGVQPELSLNYSSNDSSNINAFGYGWDISIPTISRVNKSGTNALYTSTKFTSSLDGELVQVGSTTSYKPRVENGSFRTYTFNNNAWAVVEKSGTTYSFGSTTSARRDSSASSTQVYSWHLEEARDTDNNFIAYQYYKDAGAIYPLSITYTGNATTTGIFTIDFTRESRPDAIVSYEAGFPTTVNYRISKIEAKVQGEWVYSYDIDYTAGLNGNRSLLTSITKAGRTEEGVTTTLQPVTFEYETYGTSQKGWDKQTNWDIPVNVVNSTSRPDEGARFVDINGDGYSDIIKSWGSDVYPSNPAPHNIDRAVYLYTDNGWATSTTWQLPQPIEGRFGFATGLIRYGGGNLANNVDLGARFSDVNGDGYTDIVWAYRTSDINIPGQYSYDYIIREVYINNKVDGWATTTTWTLPADFLFAKDANDEGGRILDVNGDSLPDLIKDNVYLNTGAGWSQASSSWALPESETGYDNGTRMTDVNGDGLVDFIRSMTSEDDDNHPPVNRVHLNNGNGWTLASGWGVPVSLYWYNINSPTSNTLSARLVDVNGDNLTDIIRSGTLYNNDGQGVYINTGEGWDYDSAWTVPEYFNFVVSNGSYMDSGYAELDIDGDNMIDFLKSGVINSYPSYPHEEFIYVNKGTVPDLLSKIKYPEGADVDVTYEQSARYEDTSGNRINSKLSSNLNTVNTVNFDDGKSEAFTHTYTYGGGENYFASTTEKQFAGFATTTHTNSLGNITKTYIHQGNASLNSIGEVNDSFYKIGKPYLIETYDDSNNLYERYIKRWDEIALASSSSFIYQSRDLKQEYDGDSDYKASAAEYVYSNLGDLATSTLWGEVTATTTTGYFIDTGTDKRTTTYQYASSSNQSVRGLLAQELLLNQSNVKVRESKFYYDNQAPQVAVKGKLTRRDDWIIANTYATSTWTYDAYGNVKHEINPRFATTTYTYDAYNLYPSAVTNALGQTASSTYDYSSGKVRTATDLNGHTSVTTYDAFDRPLAVAVPDTLTGAPATTTTYIYSDAANNISVTIKSHPNASSTIESYQYFDNSGRKIQERVESEESNVFIVRDWEYGPEGLLAIETLPYFDQGKNASTPTNETALQTVYGYDALNRRVSVQNVLGDTTTSYDQWKEIVTDALGREKEFVYDAHKNLISVVEHNATSTYTSIYLWSAANDLTKTTDGAGNIRNFSYDGLGRRTLAQDIHAPTDSTFSIWKYEYDGAGNVSRIIDPKVQIFVNTYDLLNRHLTQDYSGNAGVEVVNVYDTCLNGVGKLCAATSSGVKFAYTYTPQGKVKTETKGIKSMSSSNILNFTTQHVYDQLGNEIETIYPDNSAVKYTYNDGGRIEQIDQKETGGTYVPLVRDVDYGPHGLVTFRENANRSYTTNTYDADAMYRLARKVVQNMPSATSSMSMMRTSGNATEIKDQVYNPLSYFATDGTLKQPAVASMAPESFSKALASSTPTLPLDNVSSIPEEKEKGGLSTSTSTLDAFKRLPISAPELKFKAPVSKHLGKSVRNGIVTYAYKTDVEVGSVAPDPATLKKAQEVGALVTTEVVAERTKFARTFATSKPKVFVTEIVSGNPMYYEDEEGKWWIAEYGVTTEDSYTYQSSLKESASVSDTKAISFVDQAVSLIASAAQSVGEFIGIIPYRAYASTGTFYPDPNVEVNTVDGTVYLELNASWNTVRGASVGTAYDSDPAMQVSDIKVNSSRRNISRSFLLFDTSSIPDGSAILNSSLKVHVTGMSAASSERRIFVVSSNPQSNTTLANDDYNRLGNTSFGNSDGTYDFGSYETIPLNEAGLGAISTTGITKLGLRTYNDLYNNPVSNSNELVVNLASSDEPGTAKDPKLVVAYGYAPGIATGLIARQQISPAEIDSIEPEFSSVFVDPDFDDIAAAYQIQVSLSATDYSVPVWDSGKVTLEAPLLNGYRSPWFAYDGAPLSQGVEYFWRMKYWDAGDSSSAWATTTVSFELQEPPLPIIDNVYQYDAVGNITAITDIRDVGNAVATLYSYDDLDRLLTVATSSASVQSVDGKVIIQPDSTNGKDTYYGTMYQAGGDPDAEYMRIGGWTDEYVSYLQFPIGDVQNAQHIESAEIRIYRGGNSGNSNDARLERVVDSWSESGVTLNSRPSSTDFGMSWHTVPSDDWLVFDVTQLVKGWKSGTYPNYGVRIGGRYTNDDHTKEFWSSEHTVPALRPKLIVKSANEDAPIPEITFATTTHPVESYTYDPAGNILSKSGQGTYIYSSPSFTNTQAVTEIVGTTGTTSFVYDKNGNLTSQGSKTYGWNFYNQLTSVTDGATTTTNVYDATGARVGRKVGSAETYFPSSSYEMTGAAATKHIYLGGELIATIYGTGTTTASTTFVHSDHLGSTMGVTDSSGNVMQETDYSAFGSVTSNTGVKSQSRLYIGEVVDPSTSLSYLNARYYDGARGQFLSQDPVFWEIGQTEDGKSVLMNPQLQNSYSYAGNNPITHKDATGRSRTSALGHMYTSFSLMPADVSRQAYQAVTAGFALPAITLMAPGTAAMATEAVATSPALAGATLNVAVRATTDFQSGQTSTVEQYAGSAAFGAATAQLSIGKGVLGTMGIAGASSAAEGYLVDGSISIPQVAANTLGAGAGKLFGKTAAEAAPTYLASPTSQAFVENATAYTTTAVTTKALTPKNSKSK